MRPTCQCDVAALVRASAADRRRVCGCQQRGVETLWTLWRHDDGIRRNVGSTPTLVKCQLDERTGMGCSPSITLRLGYEELLIHLQCKDMFRKYVCAVESSLIKTFCLCPRQIGLSGLPSAQHQLNALSTSCKSYLSQIQHSFRRTCKSPHFIIYDQELKAGFGNRNTCGLMSRINSNDILFQLPVQGCLNTLVTINPPESTAAFVRSLTETAAAAQGRRALFFLRRKRRLQGLCLHVRSSSHTTVDTTCFS